MLVVGILVFAFQTMARQQNLHAHRIAYGQVCEDLARSGLTVLSTRFQETFRRSGKLLPLLGALGNTRLGFFVNSRPEQINQRFAQLGSSSDAVFRNLLGPDYRYPLDQMLERVPGAVVDLTIVVAGKPLYEGCGVEDPVEKTCDLTLSAKATYLGVTRRVSTGYVIKVVHPAPPLTAKFTLFSPDAAAEWNAIENDKEGRLTGSRKPAILQNTPFEDGADGLSDAALIQRNADAATVRAALTNRGQIYLGAKGQSIALNLAAGRGYLGEFFHLYSPQRVATAQLYTKLFDPPAFFNPWTTSGFSHDKRYENADHFQYPNLSQIHYGFDTTLAGDPVLGESLTAEGKSSALHLFGTADEPSRTTVWGEVEQAVCKITRVGLEAEPKATPGATQSAPSKTYQQVPYLPYCPSAEAFTADLAAEESGTKPKYLADIKGEFSAAAGASPAFAMDPNVYRHRDMFRGVYAQPSATGRASGYAGYMSRVERFSFAEMADAMLYPSFFPPSSAPAGTFQSVLELPYASYRDVKQVELTYSDSLHRQLGQSRYYAGDLSRFFTPAPDQPSPAETILRARVMREYDSQAEFLAACTWPPGSKHLEIWESVRILNGGLNLVGTYRGIGQVIVENGTIVADHLNAMPLPDGSPSLVTFAALKGDVSLQNGPDHEGYWLAPQGSLTVAGDTSNRVLGTVAAGRLSPDQLGGALLVSFPSHGDPTRADDAAKARYSDYYMVGMGSMPVSVERTPQ